MPRFVWKLLGVLILIVLLATPLALAVRYQLQTRNFRAVREGVLYRSGQMTQGGLKRVINDYGIRTVVSLRDSYVPGQPPPDRDEERFCRKLGLNYHRITPRHWEGRKGEPAPVEVNVKQFLDILSDATNYPVLVHCFGGVHRAGAYSALYRMEFEGWSNEQAIEEMKATGYTNLDDHRDILGFMEKYRPTRRQALNGSAPHR